MWYTNDQSGQQEQSPYPRDLPPVIQQILAMPGLGDHPGVGQGADFANMDVGPGGIMVPEKAGGDEHDVEMDQDDMKEEVHLGAAGAWNAPHAPLELQDLVEPDLNEGNPIWASYCYNWFQRYPHPEYSKYTEASWVMYLNQEYPANRR